MFSYLHRPNPAPQQRVKLPPIRVFNPRTAQTRTFAKVEDVWPFVTQLQDTDCVLISEVTQGRFVHLRELASKLDVKPTVVLDHWNVQAAQLVVKLPENAPIHREFYTLFLPALRESGLLAGAEESMPGKNHPGLKECSCGDCTHNTVQEPSSQGAACVERAFAPEGGNCNRLLIEVSRDGPYSMLVQKAKWWFEHRDVAVKSFFSLKHERASGTLLFQQWCSNSMLAPRQQVRTCLCCLQVLGEQRELAFTKESLLGRDPDAANGENDVFIISTETLVAFATRIAEEEGSKAGLPGADRLPCQALRVVYPSQNGELTYFHSVESLLDFISNVKEDCVVVENFGASELDQLISRAYARGLAAKIDIRRWTSQTRTLVALLPDNAPKYSEFRDVFSSHLAAPQYLGVNHVGGRPNWTNIVLEVGVDFPLEWMQEQAKWYLTASEGAVKVVLLVKINKKTSSVVFETCKLFPTTPDGSTDVLVPERDRHILIAIDTDLWRRSGPLGPNHRTCCRLVAPDKVMKLEPDATINSDQLTEMAASVWQAFVAMSSPD